MSDLDRHRTRYPGVDRHRRRALDADGGLRWTGLRGHVRVENTPLRSLELAEYPDLVSLDLSGCTTDLRLHIELPPRLRYLRLPRHDVGATIEMNLPGEYGPMQALMIEGAIAHFGLCAPWLVHPFRLEKPRGQATIRNLAIGPPTPRAPWLRAATRLVLGRACRSDGLELDCLGVEHLVLFGVLARRVTLANASLATLQVLECPRLARFDGNFSSRQASFEVCRSLHTIGGSGRRLEVSCSRSGQLRIAGRWLETRLSFSDHRRIELTHRTRLQLTSMPALCEVQCPQPYEFDIDGNMLASDHLAALAEEPPGRLAALVARERDRFRHGNSLPGHWLRLMSNSKRFGDEPTRALGLLKNLAAREPDRETAWLLRCQVNALHRRPELMSQDPAVAFREASAQWHWFEQEHGHHGHWFDDLSLYFLCRDERVTAPFRRSLGRLDRLVHAEVLTLAMVGHRRQEFDRATCMRSLRACLQRIDGCRELRCMHALSAARRVWRPIRHDPERLLAQRCCDLVEGLARLGVCGLLDPAADFIVASRVSSVVLRAGLGLVRHDRDLGRSVLARGLVMEGEPEIELRTQALRELLAADQNGQDQGDRSR